MRVRVVAALLGLCLVAVSVLGADAPTTIHNDDSCDIMVTLAATSPLPYFEVDADLRDGQRASLTVPLTARSSVSDAIFPPNPSEAVAGWMYLNLDNDVAEASAEGASQNWVVVSMAADGRHSVDFTATALGDGWSPVLPVTNRDGHPPSIGPPANRN
jgi:hypothetical protein